MLAELLLRDDPVWLIDEFCADLDPLSARIVAHNVRKHVQRTGRIAFIAAANHGHFLDALRPTEVVQLRLGGSARFLKFREYLYEQQAVAT
jgi:ABC-type ATPase with predicted acetyltransferase domain